MTSRLNRRDIKKNISWNIEIAVYLYAIKEFSDCPYTYQREVVPSGTRFSAGYTSQLHIIAPLVDTNFVSLKKPPLRNDLAVEITFAKSPHDSNFIEIQSWSPKLAFYSIELYSEFSEFTHFCIFWHKGNNKIPPEVGLNGFFGLVFIPEVIKLSCMFVKKLTLLVTQICQIGLFGQKSLYFTT